MPTNPAPESGSLEAAEQDYDKGFADGLVAQMKNARARIEELESAGRAFQATSKCNLELRNEALAELTRLRSVVEEQAARVAELEDALLIEKGLVKIVRGDLEAARARVAELEAELSESRAQTHNAGEDARHHEGLHREAIAEIHKLLEPRASIGDSEMMQLLRRVNREFEIELGELRPLRAELESAQHAYADLERSLESARMVLAEIRRAISVPEAKDIVVHAEALRTQNAALREALLGALAFLEDAAESDDSLGWRIGASEALKAARAALALVGQS